MGKSILMKSKNELMRFKLTVSQKFLLILMGIAVFSSFGTSLFLDILGLPLALPELFFLIILFFLRKLFANIRIDRRALVIMGFAWFTLLSLSILIGTYQPHFILSNARGWLYLILFYSLACKSRPLNDEIVVYICLGSIIGWVMATLTSVSMMLAEGGFVGTNGNLLVIPLFIAITYKKKQYGIFWTGILLLVIISILSGVRRCLFITVSSLIVVYLIVGLSSVKKIVRTLSLWGIVAALFSLGYSYLESFIYDISPMLYHRTFGRFEDVDDSDETRFDMLNSLFDGINNFIPQGFYSSRTAEDGTGGFIDLPISGLFYIFGFPLTLVLLSILFVWFLKALKKNYKLMPPGVLAIVTSVIMIYMMLFFEGSFIAVLYCTPITGYILGRLRYYSCNRQIA